MDQEGHSAKPSKPSKRTRLSVSLMGTEPEEGKSLQDIVRENPGGTLSIRPKKKKKQTQQSEQNASPLSGNYPALVHQTLRHWRDYLPRKYHGGMGRPD